MNRHLCAIAIVATMCSAPLSYAFASVNESSADADFGNVTLPNAASQARLAVKGDISSTDQATSGNPLWGISIEALHATRERPLFSPSRRPPAPAVISPPVAAVEVAAPPPPSRPALNLLGIVEGNGEGYAVFLNTTTHDIVRLKTGEGEDGWVLRSVSGRQAVVQKDDRSEVIELPPLTEVPK